MLRRAIAAVAAAAALSAAAAGDAGGVPQAPQLRFALSGGAGETLTQSDFRGRYVIAYFGYTRCADICPGDLARLAAALDRLAPIAGRLAPLFVDVDPRPDPAGHLSAYVRHFHPRLLALDGPADAVREAADSLGARVTVRDADGELLIDHSSSFYLVGPDGRLLAELPRWMSVRELVAAIAWFTISPSEADGSAGAGVTAP